MNLPTRQDLITQVQYDLEQAPDAAYQTTLTQRLAAVQGATSDEAARAVYGESVAAWQMETAPE